MIKNKELKISLQEQIKQLRIINETNSNFISLLAHDLRNNLNCIVGFSDLLLTNIAREDKKKILYCSTVINSKGRETYQFMENLLMWSKSRNGKLKYDYQEFRLDELLAESILLSENMASAKNITITLNSKTPFRVLADRGKIIIVMQNLISNAIKFTKPNGSITIIVQQQSNKVAVIVEDSGVGINDKIKEKLFKTEEKMNTYGSENEPGSGFGLILCKEIISKHSSEINFESDSEKGSTFFFTLPLINV